MLRPLCYAMATTTHARPLPSCALCGDMASKVRGSRECTFNLVLDNGYWETVGICGACVKFLWRHNTRLEGREDDLQQARVDRDFWFIVRDECWTVLERELRRKGYSAQISSLDFASKTCRPEKSSFCGILSAPNLDSSSNMDMNL